MSVTVTEAAALPVTVEQAKLHVRQDDNDDDETLTRNIKGAATWFRNFTNRQPVNATVVQTFDKFDSTMVMDISPLSSVTTVQYVDADGATQTASSSLYDVDTGKEPGEVRLAYNQSWPTIRNQVDAITVTYVSGYGATDTSVPDQVQELILRYVTALYEFRFAIPVDIMHALERMAMPWRIKNFV